MKIIKRIEDDVVLYAGDEIYLAAEQAGGIGWADQSTTSANAVLVDQVTLPSVWAGGAYSYVDGAWMVANQALLLVPTKVTMRQARRALLGAGLLASVTAAIAALPSPQKEEAQIEWEYSQEVQRHNGFVSLLAPSLGLSAAQLDALFVTAAAL